MDSNRSKEVHHGLNIKHGSREWVSNMTTCLPSGSHSFFLI